MDTVRITLGPGVHTLRLTAVGGTASISSVSISLAQPTELTAAVSANRGSSSTIGGTCPEGATVTPSVA